MNGRHAPKRSWRCAGNLLALSVAMAAFVGVASVALPMISSDWRAKSVLVDQSLWESGSVPWRMEQWEHAEQALLKSLSETPNDAVLMDALARLYALRGNQEWTGGAPGSPEVGWYGKALEYQKRSITVRPGFATSWANRALYESALNLPTEVWLASWEKARALGPNEITVRQTLEDLAIRHWAEVPESVQNWIKEISPDWQKKLDDWARYVEQHNVPSEDSAASAPESSDAEQSAN